MPSPDNEAGFENADLEKGVTHQLSQSPTTLSSPATWSASTARTFQGSHSLLRKAYSWPQGVGKHLRPKTSSSKAKYTVDKLEDFPNGYSRVSCLLDSDESFMTYRRFGRLHARLLLYKQDQLREFEEELLLQDKLDDADEARRKALQCREEDDELDPPEVGRLRQEILADIEKTLLEYGTLLKQAHDFQEMARPTDRDHASLTTYFDNTQPLLEADRDFLLHKADLVTIRGNRDRAWLDSSIESVLRWYSRPLAKWFFCDEETRQKTIDPNVHYFTRTRINFVATLIITLLISILLIVPIWVLFWITTHFSGGTGNLYLVIVVLAFTVLFNCTLSFLTSIKRHEMLAASVGYCAVLVVFVGNVGNNLSGPST